jgi:hypothetical protein
VARSFRGVWEDVPCPTVNTRMLGKLAAVEHGRKHERKHGRKHERAHEREHGRDHDRGHDR